MTGQTYRLSDEFLYEWLHGGEGASGDARAAGSFSYAVTGYSCREEYEQDRALLHDMNNAARPQTVFLMIHAAKVERTDPAILGLDS